MKNMMLFLLAVALCSWADIALAMKNNQKMNSNIHTAKKKKKPKNNKNLHEAEHGGFVALLEQDPQRLLAAVNSGCIECLEHAIHFDTKKLNCLQWLWSKDTADLKERDREKAVWAAAHMNVLMLRPLLDHYPEVIDYRVDNRTLLFLAVWDLNVSLVKFFLKRGASPNSLHEVPYQKHVRCSPLEAVFKHDEADDDKVLKIVNLLMKHGADPNFERPLLCASNCERMGLLIDHGACIDSGIHDDTSLFHAMRNFKEEEFAPSSRLNRLLKKILVKGRLQTSEWNESIKVRVERVLTMERLFKKFSNAGMPRDVIAYLLNYLPVDERNCSVSVLAALGSAISPEHVACAVEYVPQPVFQLVCNQIPEDRRSGFRKKIVDALVVRRLDVLRALGNVIIPGNSPMSRVFLCKFIQKRLPEYSKAFVIPDFATVTSFPALKLIVDVRAHYHKLLGGK